MFERLTVKNVAIIPEITVSFENGLNVLSGETGAGKSILVGSIGLLSGERASSEIVRSGEKMASVEGVLSLPKSAPIWKKIEALGLPRNGDEIILRRTVSIDGKSRAFVNDASTTIGVLAELASEWIDVSGQHSSQRLLAEEFHLTLIDEYAGLTEACTEYAAAYQKVRKIQLELATLRLRREEALKQKEFLSFQMKEFEKIDLKPGELEELEDRHRRQANVEQIADLGFQVERALIGEEGSFDRLGKATNTLRLLCKVDPSVSKYIERVEKLSAELSDLSNEIQKYNQSLEHAPDQLDEINDRLARLQSIARKYGSIEAAIQEKDKVKSLLSLTEDAELDERELKTKFQEEGMKLLTLAESLQKKRKAATIKFSKEVSDELKHLGMSAAQVKVEWIPFSGDETVLVSEKKLGPQGLETARLLFAPNRGEGFLPLSKIASGGELSRILLSIKSIALFRSSESSITYLFDEVDAGIGGETAERVGIRLKTLSEGRQVLCVTHLAQIASYASHHYNVEKKEVAGRTVAKVTPLTSEKDKRSELSRMIGGKRVLTRVLTAG